MDAENHKVNPAIGKVDVSDHEHVPIECLDSTVKIHADGCDEGPEGTAVSEEPPITGGSPSITSAMDGVNHQVDLLEKDAAHTPLQCYGSSDEEGGSEAMAEGGRACQMSKTKESEEADPPQAASPITGPGESPVQCYYSPPPDSGSTNLVEGGHAGNRTFGAEAGQPTAVDEHAGKSAEKICGAANEIAGASAKEEGVSVPSGNSAPQGSATTVPPMSQGDSPSAPCKSLDGTPTKNQPATRKSGFYESVKKNVMRIKSIFKTKKNKRPCKSTAGNSCNEVVDEKCAGAAAPANTCEVLNTGEPSTPNPDSEESSTPNPDSERLTTSIAAARCKSPPSSPPPSIMKAAVSDAPKATPSTETNGPDAEGSEKSASVTAHSGSGVQDHSGEPASPQAGNVASPVSTSNCTATNNGDISAVTEYADAAINTADTAVSSKETLEPPPRAAPVCGSNMPSDLEKFPPTPAPSQDDSKPKAAKSQPGEKSRKGIGSGSRSFSKFIDSYRFSVFLK